jgi:hypothetical protein
MKKFNRTVTSSLLIAASFLASACGQMNSHYSTTGASTAAGAATNSTPTAYQGEWINCTGSLLTTFSFVGNGYWFEQDPYSSSDCSDAKPISYGAPTEGTFVLSSSLSSGSAGVQQVTLEQNSGQPISGTFALVGSNLIVSLNETIGTMGTYSVTFTPQLPGN